MHQGRPYDVHVGIKLPRFAGAIRTMTRRGDVRASRRFSFEAVRIRCLSAAERLYDRTASCLAFTLI